MGMSTHVVGFKPADAKWKKMKAVWDACDEAKTEVPDSVEKFFDGVYPGDAPGMFVNIEKATTEWGDNGCSGYEVDLTKLPKDVTVIRFFNSW
jgi:hypothetical protein